MSERLALIARIGAAMGATTDPALQAVLSDALAAIVDDHGVIAAHERRKEKDRKRKHSVDSKDSVESADSVEGVEIQHSPSPSSPPSLLSPTPPNNSSPPSPPSPAATHANGSPPAPPAVAKPRAVGFGPEVGAVLEHYRSVHPLRRPSDKDRTAIARALKTYSVRDLCDAIDGNAADLWHREKAKHELTYVLRDNGKIDGFIQQASRSEVRVVNGWFADVPA